MESDFPIITKIFTTFLPFIIPIVLIALSAIWKKDISNLYKGITFRRNTNFQEDDIVFLEDRPARIVKIGTFKTKFYMLDRPDVITVRIFNNYDIDRLKLEKIIPRYKEEKK